MGMKLIVEEKDIIKCLNSIEYLYQLDLSVALTEKLEKYLKMIFILLSKASDDLREKYENEVYGLFYEMKNDGIISLSFIYNVNAFIRRIGFKTLEEYFAFDYSCYDETELKKEYKKLKRELIASKL